jgi:3-phytase
MDVTRAGWALTTVLLLSSFLPSAEAAPLPADAVTVPSADETTPSLWAKDSVDDPAIWVNRSDPAGSLVVGNNKRGALEVYDLDGNIRQRITQPTGFWGNVDIRGDLVVASKLGMMIYTVDASRSKPLVLAKETTGHASTAGEGLCLYDSGAPGLNDGLFGITVQKSMNRVRVHPLTDSDADGLLTIGKPVKTIYYGSEAEGCVVDDGEGQLYLSEEDVGIWRYDLTLAGSGVPPPVLVDGVGPQLAPDVEGLTLAGGYLIASAQNLEDWHSSWFNV